jgi:hypothetical protein
MALSKVRGEKSPVYDINLPDLSSILTVGCLLHSKCSAAGTQGKQMLEYAPFLKGKKRKREDLLVPATGRSVLDNRTDVPHNGAY